MRAVVTTDPVEAAAAAARGERSILVVRPDAQVASPIPGQVAILVGDPTDPATLATAAAMERELFALQAGAPSGAPTGVPSGPTTEP